MSIALRYILGTNAFPAYHIGRLVELRECWMRDARLETDKSMRRRAVQFARKANHDVLRQLTELKRRQTEWREKT